MSHRLRAAGIFIVAMFAFTAIAIADSGVPVKQVGPGAKLTKELASGEHDGASASVDHAPPLANVALAAPPVNDTCAGAVPLTLNLATKGTTLDANDDYQSPADTTCYAGIGQTPTSAPGRDIVFSFTAPADGSYTIEVIQQSPNDAIRTQNEVLYQTDCVGSGLMNCIKGINRPQSAAFTSSTGSSNNQSEALDCIPMTTGQTVFVVFDDASPGKCSNNNHNCFFDSDCATGSTCTPSLNTGGVMSLEVRPCNPEVEPNDTTATATPLACGMIAESSAAPAAHCYLGTRAGAVCTRSGFLEQTLPNSNMRCSATGAQCAVDVLTGVSADCPLPALCQQQTDLDCDPRCDVGPNAGKSCTTQAFCNPVSDQGATCAGTCQVESTCIDSVTNADSGVPCTPVCVGGLFPGRYCSALSGCPGGGVCTTSVAGVNCAAGQSCSRVYNEGDVDYYSLGVVAAGDAIFAGVDGKASSDYDFRMRITTDTQTLQFDDDDVTSRGGSSAPTIAGAPGLGTPTFISVSRTQPRTSATYELYAHTRPPLAAAQVEDESVSGTGNDNYFLWPGDLLNINPVTAGGYVTGEFGYNQDTDCFKFLVSKGDLLDLFGAANPARAAGGINLVDQPQPLIYDAEPAGISNFGFGANPRKNTNAATPQPSLNALSPAVTSSYFQWRASYTGMMEVCYFAASQFLSQGTPSYPNSWSGSMTANCGPVQNAGPGTTTTDVSVTKTGPAGPVTTGDFIDYTITVTNNGNEIAQEVALFDTLDVNLTFLGLTVDDTLGGNNVACYSLPDVGDPTNNSGAPIYCINASMAPGTVTTYLLSVQVNNCIGDGVVINNDAILFQVSTDPDPSNDQASASFTTVAAANNGCTDIICDAAGCIADLCTNNDHCDLGACVADVVVCDDSSLCTDDSCSSSTGCLFDPTNAGDLCDDFNACTANACDPVLFCVFPVEPSNTTCDDGLACTVTDRCDGAGLCVGASVCDDSIACTDDFADEANACACSYSPSVAGAACNDNDACTGTGAAEDGCNGAGVCVGGQAVACDDGDACNGVETCDAVSGCVAGTPPVCDDGSICTTDTCDPALGCVYTPITCDDGNACNGVETCDSVTGCGAGTPLDCNDLNGCTDDACVPASGCVYTNNVASCNDSNACTTSDTCAGGACVGGSAPNCNDANGCTDDSCVPASGCVNTNNAASCNDSNACTTSDTCAGGACVGGSAPNCNDANGCTDDSCVPASGCVNTNNAASCNDGNACTTNDTCAGGACVGGSAPNCNDANGCTNDSCVPATGCVNTNNTASCNDSNACTTNDTCAGGACVGGSAPNCNDANGCTNDSCVPASGCVNTNNTASCNDGNACTINDACAGGACVGGSATNCNDLNVCTNDSCVPASGCVNTNNTASCDDSNACTTSDTCAGGACVGGAAVSCPDDGDVCTADVCDPASGCGADINLDASNFSDTRIDGLDLALLAGAWNSCPTEPRYSDDANIDRIATLPGVCIGATDFHLFMNAFGRSCQ